MILTMRSRLKEMRESRGLTQQQLAEAAGIAVSTVSKIECNRQYPDGRTLLKLARALGVRVDDLIEAAMLQPVAA